MLAKNKWPGNIRELRNVIEMAVFMYDDVTLRPEHLDSMDDSHIKSIESVPLFRPAEKDNLSVASQPLEKGKPLDEHLISLVEQTVKRYNGNKAAAARSLDISRSSVYRILERLKQA